MSEKYQMRDLLMEKAGDVISYILAETTLPRHGNKGRMIVASNLSRSMGIIGTADVKRTLAYKVASKLKRDKQEGRIYEKMYDFINDMADLEKITHASIRSCLFNSLNWVTPFKIERVISHYTKGKRKDLDVAQVTNFDKTKPPLEEQAVVYAKNLQKMFEAVQELDTQVKEIKEMLTSHTHDNGDVKVAMNLRDYFRGGGIV